MTLPLSQLIERLHQKEDDFKYFSNSALKVYKQFRQSLGELSLLSSEKLQEQLRRVSYPGARLEKSPGKFGMGEEQTDRCDKFCRGWIANLSRLKYFSSSSFSLKYS